MLCYVMLCYVMLCYVMLCYVMLCYVMLCYVMLCYVMLSLFTHEWINPICYSNKWRRRGLVVRALDLKSGGPEFKSLSLPLDGFVFGGPKFNSSMLCE